MKRFTILNMKKVTLFDQRRNFKYNYSEKNTVDKMQRCIFVIVSSGGEKTGD